MSISVCMATYNGGLHVAEQLESIIGQLGPGDEIVIVDDHSTDETLTRVDRVVAAHDVVEVAVHVNAENLGHVATFERALQLASNDLLVLADQDDVWLPGYLDALRRVVDDDPSAGLIIGRPVFCDADLLPIDASNERYRHPRQTGSVGVAAFLLNRAMPIGCTMSVRRSELEYLLPFPDDLVAHDHWIFAMSTLRRRMRAIPDDVIRYRRHEGAVTVKGTPIEMVARRLRLLRQIASRLPMFDGRRSRMVAT